MAQRIKLMDTVTFFNEQLGTPQQDWNTVLKNVIVFHMIRREKTRLMVRLIRERHSIQPISRPGCSYRMRKCQRRGTREPRPLRR